MLTHFRQARLARKQTQADVAAALGLTGRHARQQIGAWERAEGPPPPIHHRPAMLCYLHGTLRLLEQRDLLRAVWDEIVRDWQWAPISDAEWAAWGVFPDALTHIAPIHQVPPPPDDMVGRDALLTDLTSWCRESVTRQSASVLGLAGAPGMGKTTLAQALVAQIAGNFPNGQLLVDVRGGHENPLSGRAALQEVIRALKTTLYPPDSLTELRNLYLTVLTGLHVVIVVENVMNRDQVDYLVPPPGNLLILVGRTRVLLDGIRPVPVECLPRDASCALLTTITPATAPVAPALASLCGDIPLALRLCATRLLHDPACDPQRFVQDLADEQQRLALLTDLEDDARTMTACIATSYGALSADLQQTMAHLGILRGPFDAALVGAILPGDLITTQDVGDALRRLYYQSLITWNVAQKRYVIHDLIRLFALRHLADPGPVWERYAPTVLGTALRASALYWQGGSGIYTALATLDADWQHIAASWEWLMDQCRANAQPAHLALLAEYAQATAFLGIVRYGQQRYTAADMAQLIALQRAQGNQRGELALLLRAASTTINHEHPTDALPLLERARELSWALQDVAAEVGVERRMGHVYRWVNANDTAIGHFTHALTLARSASLRREEVALLNQLGNCVADRQEHRAALAYYHESLTLAEAIGDVLSMAFAHGNSGHVLLDQGDLRGALAHFDADLALSEHLGAQTSVVVTLANRSTVYRLLGVHDLAIADSRRALMIAQEIDDRRGATQATMHLIDALTDSPDVQDLPDTAPQLIPMTLEIEDIHSTVQAHLSLARWWIRQGDVTRAHEHLDAAQQDLPALDDPSKPGDVAWVTGQLHMAEGAWAAARTATEQALAIAQAVGSAWREALAHHQLAQIAEQQNDLVGAIAALRACLIYRTAVDHRDRAADARWLQRLEGLTAREVGSDHG